MSGAATDPRSRAFSGTLVTQGTGRGRVQATGERSALGRIGASLQAITTENTPVQRETGRIVTRKELSASAREGVGKNQIPCSRATTRVSAGYKKDPDPIETERPIIFMQYAGCLSGLSDSGEALQGGLDCSHWY